METFEVKSMEAVILALAPNVPNRIKSVVWRVDFFEVNGGAKGVEFVKKVNVSRETIAKAEEEEGFTTFSNWYAKHKTDFVGIGTRLICCFLLESGNEVSVADVVGTKVAYTADENHTPTTLSQSNDLVRLIAKVGTTAALLQAVGGLLSYELSEAFYVFKKKDNSFSREFQHRTWKIELPKKSEDDTTK